MWHFDKCRLGRASAENLCWKSHALAQIIYEISNNAVCVTSKGSGQPVHMHSLIRAFASCLNILQLLSCSLSSIWSFYADKMTALAHLSLFMSKCHIVGNHMWWLNYVT